MTNAQQTAPAKLKEDEGRERHAQSTRQDSGKYPQARDETRPKDCPLTMLQEHLLGFIVPFAKPRKTPTRND